MSKRRLIYLVIVIVIAAVGYLHSQSVNYVAHLVSGKAKYNKTNTWDNVKMSVAKFEANTFGDSTALLDLGILNAVGTTDGAIKPNYAQAHTYFKACSGPKSSAQGRCLFEDGMAYLLDQSASNSDRLSGAKASFKKLGGVSKWKSFAKCVAIPAAKGSLPKGIQAGTADALLVVAENCPSPINQSKKGS